MDHAPSFESGGAGLCSTLDDYLKFALMLVNGGEYNGKRILQKKTVEYFTKARLTYFSQSYPFPSFWNFKWFFFIVTRIREI